MLLLRLLPEHSQRHFADRFRHFLVSREVLQVVCEQDLHQSERQVDRRARIENQIALDVVVLGEPALERDLTQDRLQHVLLLREVFNFAVGELRRLKHRQRHDLRAVADEDRSIFLAAANRQRNPALDVELGDLLQRAVAPLRLTGGN